MVIFRTNTAHINNIHTNIVHKEISYKNFHTNADYSQNIELRNFSMRFFRLINIFGNNIHMKNFLVNNIDVKIIIIDRIPKYFSILKLTYFFKYTTNFMEFHTRWTS